MMGSCPECNGKLSSEAEFCPHCGYRIQRVQPPPQLPPPVQNVTVKVEKSSSCVSEGCGCLIIVAGVALLLMLLGACPGPVPVKSFGRVENSIEMAAETHLRYVESDPKLSAKDKEDWKKFYKSQLDNVEAIKKAHE